MIFVLVNILALAVTILVYWTINRIRKQIRDTTCRHVNRQRYQTSYGGEYLVMCADCNKQWMERS